MLADLWFYRSDVDVSPRGIAITDGLFGLNSTRWIDAADIKKIDCEESMQWSTILWNGALQSGNTYYDLVVVCDNGKSVTIGKRIIGLGRAKIIAQQIEQAMTVSASSIV